MNIELLKQIRNNIELTPGAYDQGAYGYNKRHDRIGISPYSCNSPACIAGWAIFISNFPVKGEDELFVDITDMVKEWVEEIFGVIPPYTFMSYSFEWIEEEARRLLCLTEKEAEVLLDGHWPNRWATSNEISVKNLPNEKGFHPDVLDAIDILDKLIEQGGFV